jgi:putative transposase
MGPASPAFDRWQIIWAKADVCGLLSANLGCWQNNVGQEPWILSDNPGRNRRCLQVGGRMFASRYIYSRKIVAWEVHASETAEHASTLMRKACLAEGVHRAGLVVHADNGAPMKAATLLATLQRLGIVPSFSRPAVSNDNPYSESLFGTMKYTPAFPDKPFESLEEARAWVYAFVQCYNAHHQHSGIRFVTPAARHSGEEEAILNNRKIVYEAAKQCNPQRWSGETRNWEPVGTVWLNPDKPDAGGVEIRDIAA